MKRALLLPLLLAAAAHAAAPVAEVPDIKPGDSWTYEERDGYNQRLKGSFRVEVQEVTPERVAVRVVREGGETSETFDRAWNPLVRWSGAGRTEYSPAFPALAFPLAVGKTWRQDVEARDEAGRRMTVKVHGKVLGQERVRVPAGEFDTIKVRRQVYPQDQQWWRSGTRILEYDWYAPSVGRVVRHWDESEYTDGTRSPRGEPVVRGDRNLVELAAWRAGNR